ncbi:MAG: SMP-30/gluconolactonase/LRE family protein [Candidatus Limnocylindrales bacterium]
MDDRRPIQADLFPAPVLAVRDSVRELRTLAGGIDHPECVAWFDGRVWCGTESGDLLAIDPASGAVETVAHPGGFIAGIAFDQAGRCWICDVAGGRVVRMDRDRRLEVVVEAVDGRRLATPNYPAVARDGTVWISDSGTGWGADDGFLFRIGPDAAAALVDDSCGRFPNGIALSAAEDTLYLVESRLPGIVVYALAGDRTGDRRELLRMPGTVPDGIALDDAGCLYIGCWRPDRIYRLHADGSLDVFLDDPTAEYLNSPTNIAFGGSDGRRLYVSGLCGWAITEIDVDVPGRRLPG